MRSSDEEFNSSSERVLNDNEHRISSNNLAAFCTLRKDRTKQKKPTADHSSSLNFCTLRIRRDKSPNLHYGGNATNGGFVVPYNRLNESFSNENSFDDENLIDLDDSGQADAEAINRSLIEQYEAEPSAWKPKFSHSTSNTLEKSDRKQSLKELKRLSSYCTLRPEQRRKFILRTISTLRNSNKISDEANKTLSLLHELNGFNAKDDDNCCATSATDIAACFSDPEKVEDCLLELDAYLEEIDRNYSYSNNNINSDAVSMETENNFPLDKVVYVQQCKANCNNETNDEHDADVDDGGSNKNSREDVNEKVDEIATTTTTTSGEENNCGYSEFLNRFSDCDNNTNGVTMENNCRMSDVNAHECSYDGHGSDRLSDAGVDVKCIDDDAIEFCRGQSHRNTINVASGSTFPRSSPLTKGKPFFSTFLSN